MPQPISGTLTEELERVQNAVTCTCLLNPKKLFFTMGVSIIVGQALARLISGTGQVLHRSGVQRWAPV